MTYTDLRGGGPLFRTDQIPGSPCGSATAVDANRSGTFSRIEDGCRVAICPIIRDAFGTESEGDPAL